VTRIKICGITRPEDARAAAELGVDAIGLVLTEQSKRYVNVDQALEICRALPPFVSRVGLFMDQDAGLIHDILTQIPLDCLQFHGRETARFCRQFNRPWIKALAMAGHQPPDFAAFETADALLLDSHVHGQPGGTGVPFEWGGFDPPDRPWILAGGLNPENVALACRQLQPHAVDVSSGVEEQPGIKDHQRMKAFIKAVRHG
jgi:phosphoribosylanthranilate isomerase